MTFVDIRDGPNVNFDFWPKMTTKSSFWPKINKATSAKTKRHVLLLSLCISSVMLCMSVDMSNFMDL